MDALLNRIVMLCKGDKVRAKKLVEEAMSSQPGQSALWYLQKVISDLEQEQANYFRQKQFAPATVATPGTSLRKLMAQSRRDNPGKSEDWHLQNARAKQRQEPIDLVESKKWKRLLTMLQGNKAAANRLIEGARIRNPKKSDQWILDKVLWDLERDR